MAVCRQGDSVAFASFAVAAVIFFVLKEVHTQLQNIKKSRKTSVEATLSVCVSVCRFVCMLVCLQRLSSVKQTHNCVQLLRTRLIIILFLCTLLLLYLLIVFVAINIIVFGIVVYIHRYIHFLLTCLMGRTFLRLPVIRNLPTMYFVQ